MTALDGVKRRGALVLLCAALAAALPAQQKPKSDAGALLDDVAATIGDAAAYGPRMLEAFQKLEDEPAFILAAVLWMDSVDGGAVGPGAADTFGAIRDRKDLPGPKRLAAARLRTFVHAMLGKADAFRKEAGLDEVIRDFMVIGPFGFSAESFTGFSYPPEKTIDFAATYDGYDGKVSWTPLAVSAGTALADPFEVVTPKAGVTYALAQLHVPEARTLLVRLDGDASFELFIDGKRALVHDRKSQTLPLVQWVTASFPAGWHRLLVKTNDAGEGAFKLSVGDPARGLLPISHAADATGLRVETKPVLHPVDAPATGTGAGGAFVQGDFRDLIKPVDDRARKLVVAYLKAWLGLPEEAYADAEPFLDAKDLGTGELWIASELVNAAWHLPENDKKARLLDLAKRAVAAAPEFPPAVAVLARNEATNDRAEEGIAMLQKAIAAHPRSADLRDAELEILQTVGFESDRDRALEAALKACPDSSKLLGRKLGQLEKKRALGPWTDVALRLLALKATSQELSRAAGERLLAARRFDDLRTLLDKQRALFPNDLVLANIEADSAHERGDLDGERKALEAIAARHPLDTNALRTLGERAQTAGNEDDARKYLAAALARDGDLHDVRRQLAELDPPKHDYFREYLVDTDKFLAEAPGKDAYPDSRVVLLLDQIVLWVHPDGSADQETHQLHRLQDSRGKEDLGTIHADGDVKVVQTILEDGRRLVPNQAGRGGFEMAGLAPGVIVERRYRRSIDRSKGHPEAFGGFYFQDTRLTQPFHYSRYVVIVPKKLGLEPVVERFDAEFKREERGDDIVYEFLLKRVPRIQREVMMPRPEDIVPRVEFRRPDKWNQINRRYLDVYEVAWKPTPQITEAAKKAVGAETDPVERARKLYDFVMDTVTSTDGGGWPTQTLIEKSGDRFALYLALLRAAGVPHTLAMGRSQEKLSAPIKWDLVTESLFDTPLVRIDPPGKKPVYVSTQFRYVPFGQIRHDLTDAPVFVTSADGGRIERTPAVPLSEAKSSLVEIDLALDAAGVAEGKIRMTLPGMTGAWFKEQIERTDKKRLDQMGAGMLLGPIGRLAPKPKGPVRFQNTTSRSEPLQIEVDIEMKQLVRKGEGGGTLGLPFAPMTLAKAFVDRKERKLPFVFHQYLLQDDEARITLDPAWKLDDLPKDFERSGPIGSYRLRRTMDGTKLIFRRELALTPADVPAAEFGGVASFAKDVDEAEAQKLTLRRETQ